jgi:starvation-inducible DNA-binding protein
MPVLTALPLQIGIEEPQRKEVADMLARLLADTYTLYLKTHKFHWNVTGAMFQPLHALFERQYQELALAVDVLAERIRALGFAAPGSYTEFTRLASIHEETELPPMLDMIRLLLEGHETIVRKARQAFSIAQQSNDEATMDLLTDRLQAHEKTAWILRSFLV